MVSSRTVALAVLSLLISIDAGAWSRFGHQVVVGIAQRHLTQKTKDNISTIMDYDMKMDAGWMDKHRKDPDLANSGFLHSFAVDSSFTYDPNPRVYKGDVCKAIFIADYNLKRYKSIPDSLKLLSLRMIIHFIGDINCPVHNSAPGYIMSGKWYFKGSDKGNFHHIYDAMPNVLYKGLSPDATAGKLDSGVKKKQVRKWIEGTFIDWMNLAASESRIIYDINPVSPGHGDKELAEDTYIASEKLIEERLLAAGYQLASLLNSYFDN